MLPRTLPKSFHPVPLGAISWNFWMLGAVLPFLVQSYFRRLSWLSQSNHLNLQYLWHYPSLEQGVSRSPLFLALKMPGEAVFLDLSNCWSLRCRVWKGNQKKGPHLTRTPTCSHPLWIWLRVDFLPVSSSNQVSDFSMYRSFFRRHRAAAIDMRVLPCAAGTTIIWFFTVPCLPRAIVQ